MFRSSPEAQSGPMRPAQAVFHKALGMQENPLLMHKRGLDEHQLQKHLAAEQRNHSFTATKRAAVRNTLAVFQGWKCNGLNLSLDFVEANFVARPLMLTGLNNSQFCCLLEECSIATRISLVEDS